MSAFSRIFGMMEIVKRDLILGPTTCHVGASRGNLDSWDYDAKNPTRTGTCSLSLWSYATAKWDFTVLSHGDHWCIAEHRGLDIYGKEVEVLTKGSVPSNLSVEWRSCIDLARRNSKLSQCMESSGSQWEGFGGVFGQIRCPGICASPPSGRTWKMWRSLSPHKTCAGVEVSTEKEQFFPRIWFSSVRITDCWTSWSRYLWERSGSFDKRKCSFQSVSGVKILHWPCWKKFQSITMHGVQWFTVRRLWGCLWSDSISRNLCISTVWKDMKDVKVAIPT